jgi:uncharacterized Fe-S cluster-containing radical SAM superfamily enzyme
MSRQLEDVFLYHAKLAISNKRSLGYDIPSNIIETLAEKARNTSVCRYCDVKLYYSINGPLQADTAALDRIDNGDMINENTCQWICLRCNARKGSRTHERYLEYLVKGPEVSNKGKTIRISDEAHEELISLSVRRETFSDVIMKLGEHWRRTNKVNKPWSG